MKVLNLYAGLGGNRTHWKQCSVTAVEIQPEVAAFYGSRFPNDEVVIGDAHQYLLDHFKRFDFIWSSYPCQSHGRCRFWAHKKSNPIYPELGLYEEILLLKHYFDGDWVVENVVPFYDPLMQPSCQIGRHYVWSNRRLPRFKAIDLDVVNGTRAEWESALGFSLGNHKFGQRTDQLLRNCVHPEVGRQLLEFFQGIEMENQLDLFADGYVRDPQTGEILVSDES